MPGFFSADAFSTNACSNDHSSESGDLIEVKVERFCRIFGKTSTGQVRPETLHSTTGRADRQECLLSRGNLFCFGRLRCPDAVSRTLKLRQFLFRELSGNVASRQKPVKFRMRQIEIARDLFELGAVDSLQPIQMPPPRDDAPHPAAKTAAVG
jgi:hypothetical protein